MSKSLSRFKLSHGSTESSNLCLCKEEGILCTSRAVIALVCTSRSAKLLLLGKAAHEISTAKASLHNPSKCSRVFSEG